MASTVPAFSAVRRQPVATKSAAVRRRHIGQVTVLIAAGVLMALAFVWIRIQVIQLGYEVSRIRKETVALREQKNILKSEVEELKSPARMEAIALERFGMRPPQSGEVVIIEPSATGGETGKSEQ